MRLGKNTIFSILKDIEYRIHVVNIRERERDRVKHGAPTTREKRKKR